MGQQFVELQDKHTEFIAKQKIFFVATAVDEGRVNLSPKGGDSLKVIDKNTIAWLNLTGSGNETAAHVQRNPRMTLMWCAFDGAPLILRAYGQARALHQSDAEWEKYASLFPRYTGARQIFLLHIDMVQSSCGMAVPYFDFVGDRDQLTNWADNQGREGIQNYWVRKNQKTIDGFDTNICELAGVDNPIN